MVGVRIAPDNNDIVVWKLDEATAPFVNSSTSPSSPGSSANLTVISGNTGSPPGVATQQPSPFAASGTNSCVTFSGNGSGSPRNTINGANNFLPQPPFTISMWVYIRQYNNGLTTHGLAKQTTPGVWSGSTFASIDLIQNEGYNGHPSYFDFSITYNSGGSGVNANVTSDINVPQGQWSHVGLTYDGVNIDGYINGCNVSAAAGPGFNNVYYSGSPGPWFVGAIPSGSGSPEECISSYCDIRVANIIRPVSYFQTIYQTGTQNNNNTTAAVTKYYKMRAFDTFCNKPVYWVDSAINYANAPASPCGGGLGPIEVMEISYILNG